MQAYTYWHNAHLPHWARIIMGRNRDLCPRLERIPPLAESDRRQDRRTTSNLVRLEWLHPFGGIWLDTDVLLLRPIQWILDLLDRFELVLFDEREHLGYPWASNFLMAMRAGTAIGKELCRDARAASAAKPGDSLASGPHVLQRYLDNSRVKLLPARLVYPIHWHQKHIWLEQGEPPDLGTALAVHFTHGVTDAHPAEMDKLLCSPTRFAALLRRVLLWDHDGRPYGMFDDVDAAAYIDAVYALKPGSTLVEVGTFCGRSLSYVMPAALAQGVRVYAVDAWQMGPAEPGRAQAKINAQVIFRRAMERLGFDGFVTPIKAKSLDAARQIGDVDAVYLDAAHDYARVAADIRAWLPKIRRPGWIMGHDYDLSTVREAVLELLGPPDRTTGRTWLKRLGI